LKLYDSDILLNDYETALKKVVTRGHLRITQMEGTFSFKVEVTEIDDEDLNEHTLEADIDCTGSTAAPGFDEDEMESAMFAVQRYLRDNPHETLAALKRVEEKEEVAA
jgi:hypothetical protein